jgi:hypothetical protein
MFSQADLLQIQQKGITIDQVNQQIEYFRKGFGSLNVKRPAIRKDGIIILDEKQKELLIAEFETRKKNKKLLKFVPASGAATRMFKAMFDYLSLPSDAPLFPDISYLVNHIELFAFYDDLKIALQHNNLTLPALIENKRVKDVLKYILSSEGLNYGQLPKCLLKFHNYPEGSRTALEEHMVEGALYNCNSDRSVNIHLTVSPDHIQLVRELIERVRNKYETEFKVTFQIALSVQKSSTDTLALNVENLPFRDDDGTILFRPGGHGALLNNLNEIDADIIFIKNIDNVVPDRLKDETVRYKKALAGLLMQLQQQILQYFNILEKEEIPHSSFYSEVTSFIECNLGYQFPRSFHSMNPIEQKKLMLKILNRPLRVCGMVENTDEPGGGPYWVESKDGSLSLQILELSQINLNDESQRQACKNATHFNPVDLVISTHDCKGQKFDLTQFRDPDTGFISLKSNDGKELKALELPGLWNGSMAFWNTVFVEVPMVTFAPVKTVNDLLRIEHQNY